MCKPIYVNKRNNIWAQVLCSLYCPKAIHFISLALLQPSGGSLCFALQKCNIRRICMDIYFVREDYFLRI